MKKALSTDKAPAALGPYSQAIETDQAVFVSGQMGIDPATGALVEGKEAQFKQIFKNISVILAQAGCTFDNVVKTTTFVTDIADFALFNSIYANYFQEPYPARIVVQVSALPKAGALAETEVIARKDD